MGKNIILLSDGTGNSAKKLFKTNVWRLYQALDLSTNPANPKQIAYYDDGVGTSSFLPLAILGGAFGWGTKRNVLDIYTFLCRHYEPGDSIYGFGFSRGAFTIRLLVGFIANRGLVHSEKESELRHLAAEAFRAYRKECYTQLIPRLFRHLRDLLFGFWFFLLRRPHYRANQKGIIPRIRFLGLWDTVSAYGLPIDELTRAWNLIFPLSFPDHNLSDIVDEAFHALAIDDERLTFHPQMWNENPIKNCLTQVWFAGMHSNVGGGYPDDAMSGVPLNWILDKAGQSGLIFLRSERWRLHEMACDEGKMYDSRQGAGGLYRYMPRDISTLMQKDIANGIIPKIHESVLIRINNRVDGYAPIVLPQQYDVVQANGQIVSQAGNPIRPEASQEAADRWNHQKKVWNLVWWKRLVYFITVCIFLLLAAFPLYRRATPLYEGPLIDVSKALHLVGAFLPGFLNPWLNAYENHPGLFLLMATMFAVSLNIASRLQAGIFDQMRLIFDHPLGVGLAPATPPKGIIHWLHSNTLLITISNFFKKKILPFVLAIVILMFMLRGIFFVIDSSGFTCKPRPNDCLKDSLEGGVFPSNDLCWASGVCIKEGELYEITLKIDKSLWKDSTIETGTGGFERWYLIAGIPLRRHIAQPWFKPFARIGRYGNDDYPLDPVDGSDDTTLIARITARKSGELFLFVNDAMLPVPNSWQFLYANNKGTATVSVKSVD